MKDVFKIGDAVYLKQDYCDRYRILDKERTVTNLKYYKRFFNSDYELSAYTVSYGSGGHDVPIESIDYHKTIRIVKLKELGIE